MIDFSQFTTAEINELKNVASKAVEKSAFEKVFLYTQDLDEKVKLFLFSHRFLVNIYNLIDKGGLRDEIKKLVDNTGSTYKRLLVLQLHETSYGKKMAQNEMLDLVEEEGVKEIIDLFSILTERVNLIKMSRFKGILLEGKSGEEYKKLFGEKEKKEFREV